MKKTAVVAGSTGLVGKHLVKLLAESTAFNEVTALVRSGSSFIHEDVFTEEVDYARLAEHIDTLKADAVFCCLGTTMKKAGSKAAFHKVDFDYPLALARIAAQQGSRQFHIITASGASVRSMFYYSRVKGEVEQEITKLRIPSINIYRPSLLLGKRNEQRTEEKIGAFVAAVLRPVMVGGLRRYRAIEASAVAKAMLASSEMDMEGTKVFESDAIQQLAGS
jgi:uncharacterized protein YbjT (DUF2867 family)